MSRGETMKLAVFLIFLLISALVRWWAAQAPRAPARRRGRRERPEGCRRAPRRRLREEPALSDVQRYALAIGSPLGGRREDGFDVLYPDHARSCLVPSLAEWWGISGTEDARERLGGLLHPDGYHEAEFQAIRSGAFDDEEDEHVRWVANHPDVETIIGWDLVRAVCVARWCFAIDYIDRDEAWDWIFRAAAAAQARLGSWEELGESYLAGHAFWGVVALTAAEKRQVRREMAGRGRSVAGRVPWDTPLPSG